MFLLDFIIPRLKHVVLEAFSVGTCRIGSLGHINSCLQMMVSSVLSSGW